MKKEEEDCSFDMHTRANKQKSTQNLNITNSIKVAIIGVARGGGQGPGSPNQNTINKKNVTKSLVSSVSVSFSIFAYNGTCLQQ